MQWKQAVMRPFNRLTLLISLSLLLLTACAPKLIGTDLAKDPAPDFRLSDSQGKAVALSDYRGKVVVLTFLYTNCPDECPLIAAKLRNAATQLGDVMSQVQYVAVSIDPENDTPIAVQEFLQAHALDGQMRYLIGTQAQLEPIWTAYYVGTSTNSSSVKAIAHTTRTLLIDKQGKQRVELGSTFSAADLLNDVRALVQE